MSHLISRIMLAIFMLPLAAMLYTIIAAVCIRALGYPNDRVIPWLVAGHFTWIFIAVYWIGLWWGAIRWTRQRATRTIWIALGAAAVGMILAVVLHEIVPGFGWFAGTATMPLLWLAGSTLVWRETPAERAGRLKSPEKSTSLPCPACGYDLTGLSEARCPECGGKYTLDELFAAQPGRDGAEVES